jgi:hypothetical protein
MIKDADVDRFVNAPVDLCSRVVERLDVKVSALDSTSDSAAMVAQLREIAKTIDRLEKLSVPIPDVLRAEKTRLAAALGVQDAATNSLELLAESLGIVLRDIRARLHLRKPHNSLPDGHEDRVNPEHLPRSVIRDSIIHALHSLGGRGPEEKVLEIVESELQGRFLPADLVWLDSVKKYSWQNSAKHARAELIRGGVLRNDSPKGIWELAEGYV